MPALGARRGGGSKAEPLGNATSERHKVTKPARVSFFSFFWFVFWVCFFLAIINTNRGTAQQRGALQP